MSWDRIQSETEAVQSLVQLYDHAKKCQQLFERAQMALPEPLKRFLGLEQPEHKTSAAPRLSAQIPAPSRKRPEGAGVDWVWVKAEDCRPTSLIPAVLRRAGGRPLKGREVINQVTTLSPKLVSGSIYNASTRLQRLGLIDRTDGWRVLKPEMAAIIDDGVLWGHSSMFIKEELASHRREAILHVLKHYSAGMELVQIVEQLKNCPWVKAPVNKDLLKADVQVLERDHKIRRRGNTRKWEIPPAEKGETKTE